MKKYSAGLLFGTALLSSAFAAAQSQHALSSAMIENEFVRVSQTTFSSDSLPLRVMSDDLPLLIVTLHSKSSVPANSASEPDAWSFVSARYLTKAYAEPSFRFEKGGATRQIWITLKSWPPSTPFEKDAVKLDPAHNKVVFENERVRVVHLNFPPGASGPVVDKRMRVIVMLTDSHAIVTRPDGTTAVRDGKVGTVAYSKGGSQATLNAGTTPLENIVVELKGK